MKRDMRTKKQQGFTLIELVVVIAILAILAAFALPRFAQLSEQAHQSSIRATAGALAAGVALAKSLAGCFAVQCSHCKWNQSRIRYIDYRRKLCFHLSTGQPEQHHCV